MLEQFNFRWQVKDHCGGGEAMQTLSKILGLMLRNWANSRIYKKNLSSSTNAQACKTNWGSNAKRKNNLVDLLKNYTNEKIVGQHWIAMPRGRTTWWVYLVKNSMKEQFDQHWIILFWFWQISDITVIHSKTKYSFIDHSSFSIQHQHPMGFRYWSAHWKDENSQARASRVHS